jgi:hypothetical protein
MKNKETLEEAAERFERLRIAHDENYCTSNDIQDLKESYYYKGRRDECIKWNQERSYSEEEVLQLLLRLQQTESYDNLYEWFNEFKKK